MKSHNNVIYVPHDIHQLSDFNFTKCTIQVKSLTNAERVRENQLRANQLVCHQKTLTKPTIICDNCVFKTMFTAHFYRRIVTDKINNSPLIEIS